ncbi:MAG: hypothetical protein FWD13_06590 [Treponema sp.]|nr:hypothetical protein [Treponema sp.]
MVGKYIGFIRRYRGLSLFSLFIVTCSLLIASCEGDPDYLAKLDEEVAWHNAEKLTVAVTFPPEWGASNPQQGTISPGDRDVRRWKEGQNRKMYEFTVEFLPLLSFGFEKWLAFPTSEYAALDKTKSAEEIEKLNLHLNGKGVEITESTNTAGAKIATVLISISEHVTLVPWCNNRPRLTQQTNPPITPVMAFFPYDQEINLWFNVPVDKDTVVLGDTIVIMGNYGEGNPNGSRGEPFKGDGVLSDYFEIVPSLSDRQITIKPVSDTASELALMSVRIIVGAGIKNTNGVAMAADEFISYQTDMTEAQKVYKAITIEASRNDLDNNNNIIFFSDGGWNNPAIDRRFNRTDKDTVDIRIQSINAPEGAPLIPNRITVIELNAFTLRGFTGTDNSYNKIYHRSDNDNLFNVSTSGVYTITHELKTTEPCIIQLIVLPWYDDINDPYPPLAPNTAVTQGQYVTIAMDNVSPDVEPLNAGLSTPAVEPVVNNTYIYRTGNTVTLTIGNLADITDNAGAGGIPVSQAWGFPWTMDDKENLFWYAQIGGNRLIHETPNDNNTSLLNKERITSSKMAVYDRNPVTQTITGLNNTWDVTNFTTLKPNTAYPVYVKFEDSLGNRSSEWKNTGLLVYFSDAIVSPVTNLNVICNDDGDRITVSWSLPASMSGARVYVNDRHEAVIVRDSQTGVITQNRNISVPRINDSDVTNGKEVGNVIRYSIRVQAYNISSGIEVSADSVEFDIWNIPGMSNSAAAPLEYIYTQTDFNNMVLGNTNKKYVLMNDITVTGNWTPRGHAANTNAFRGKFYGNGNTITINGGFNNTVPSSSYRGLFGYVQGDSAANQAEIRDLKLVYNADSDINVSGWVGGIAGYINNTKIINVITTGTGCLNVVPIANTADVRIGGIIGYVFSGFIQNCYAGLNVEYDVKDIDHTGEVRLGGVAGETGTGTGTCDPINNGIEIYNVTNLIIENVRVIADVKADKDIRTGRLDVGGAVGQSSGNTMRNVSVIGSNINFFYSGTDNDFYIGGYIGGVTGYSLNSNLDNCYFNGIIESFKNNSVIGVICMGGLIGISLSNNGSRFFINNCRTIGDISIEGTNIKQIGGVIGRIEGGGQSEMTITSSFYENGNILTRGDGNNDIGGFIGRIFINTVGTADIHLINCGSFGGTININNTKGVINAGGFTSVLNYTNILNCFSRINIIAQGSSRISAGGFAGMFSLSNVGSSYAAGTIRIVSNNDVNTTADVGGFIGTCGPGTIQNCYALGDVLVERTAGNIFINSGGFLGNGGTAIIENSFSTGQVFAQSQTTTARAGGFTGNRDNSTISNSAALGSRVISATRTVSGSAPPRVVGRIVGSSNIIGDQTFLDNNHAIDTMRIGTGEYIEDLDIANPNVITASIWAKIDAAVSTWSPPVSFPITNITHNAVNGASVSIDTLRDVSFWLKTPANGGLGFNLGGGGVGGISNIWDFSVLAGRGHPILVGLSGQQ